jgi:hypothetical protein
LIEVYILSLDGRGSEVRVPIIPLILTFSRKGRRNSISDQLQSFR